MLIVSDLQELFVRIQMLLKAVKKVQVWFRLGSGGVLKSIGGVLNPAPAM